MDEFAELVAETVNAIEAHWSQALRGIVAFTVVVDESGVTLVVAEDRYDVAAQVMRSYDWQRAAEQLDPKPTVEILRGLDGLVQFAMRSKRQAPKITDVLDAKLRGAANGERTK